MSSIVEASMELRHPRIEVNLACSVLVSVSSLDLVAMLCFIMGGFYVVVKN
jgi:hypothetical protein